MRIKKVKYKDEESMMIYITKEENESEEVKNKINSYKKQYKNIAVFISGNNKIEDTLNKIIKDN